MWWLSRRKNGGEGICNTLNNKGGKKGNSILEELIWGGGGNVHEHLPTYLTGKPHLENWALGNVL